MSVPLAGFFVGSNAGGGERTSRVEKQAGRRLVEEYCNKHTEVVVIVRVRDVAIHKRLLGQVSAKRRHHHICPRATTAVGDGSPITTGVKECDNVQLKFNFLSLDLRALVLQ